MFDTCTKKIFYLVLIHLLFSCARMPVNERQDAMRKTSMDIEFNDDLGFENLKKAIKSNIEYIKQSGRMPSELSFGKTKLSKKQYIRSLELLIENSSSMQNFTSNIKNNFDLYEVYGNEDWAEIKATAYYSPVLTGSYKKTKELSQALYLSPQDMVYIDVDAYIEDFPKWKIVKEQVLEQKSGRALIKGRITKDNNGSKKIVPYYSREKIDGKKSPYSSKEVIVYVDPIKAFFLHIQGSGIIKLKNGKQFTVAYANQNGYPYIAIGSLLLDKIPKEKMSMQAIEKHLKTLSKKEMQDLLNQNPSYIFFKKVDSKPLTYLGNEVIDGRTVATDNGLFPKGTLAYLEFEKPIFENKKSQEPIEWKKTSRFVLDQDTGGAIRGTGRLDLYVGSGDEAGQFAGVMKNPAKLYYVVPKADYLNKIN